MARLERRVYCFVFLDACVLVLLIILLLVSSIGFHVLIVNELLLARCYEFGFCVPTPMRMYVFME